MRKILFGALIASALGITAPPALAADSSFFVGGCGAYANPTIGEETVIVAEVEVFSTEAAENPVTATVTCTFLVNGATRWSQSFVVSPHGRYIAVLGHDIEPVDDVEICTTVDYTSNGDATDSSCRSATDISGPPTALLDPVLAPVVEATALLDPILCSVLAGLAPGVPGVVDIDAEGDVAIAGMPFWDCPPYGS